MFNEVWFVVRDAMVLVVTRQSCWQRLLLRYMVVPVVSIAYAVPMTEVQNNTSTSVAVKGKDGQEHGELRMDPIWEAGDPV